MKLIIYSLLALISACNQNAYAEEPAQGIIPDLQTLADFQEGRFIPLYVALAKEAKKVRNNTDTALLTLHISQVSSLIDQAAQQCLASNTCAISTSYGVRIAAVNLSEGITELALNTQIARLVKRGER